MKTAFVDRDVPVILGEYSAGLKAEYDKAGKYRNYWDLYVTHSARKHGIVPVYRDSGYVANHQSGLFDRNKGAGLPANDLGDGGSVEMGRRRQMIAGVSAAPS